MRQLTMSFESGGFVLWVEREHKGREVMALLGDEDGEIKVWPDREGVEIAKKDEPLSVIGLWAEVEGRKTLIVH